MKTTALTLIALCFALTTSAQLRVTSETKDVINALERLRIGRDTSLYFTSISTIIGPLSTNRQATTAKAVEDRVRQKVEYISASGSILATTDRVIVPAISTTINVVLPLCNGTLNGRTIIIENQSPGSNPVRINTIFPNVWHSGSTRVVYADRSGECTCRFSSGAGTWFFKSN